MAELNVTESLCSLPNVAILNKSPLSVFTIDLDVLIGLLSTGG